MKRPLTILMIAVLTIVLIYACGTIRTANTSFVTITIGDTPHTARLKAESATPWVRFQYFLADAKLMPEAYAYIPSVVQVIVVTVTAADITTPIVGVMNIAATDTVASVRIEVPNGSARQFAVDGIRGVDSKTYYSGTASADLNGMDVNLTVPMSFVGTGIYVDPSQPLSANTPSCGSTQASACATITYVLNTRPSTTNNDVILALAGNYIPGVVAALESFPLQLRPGMALMCLGPSLTSVFLPNNTAILGADGASIDNCRIVVSLGNVGISDLFLGQTPAIIKVNGSQLELSGNLTGGSMTGIDLNSNSTILETTVTGTGSVSGSVFGIQVNAGIMTFSTGTVSSLPTGINLGSGAGDALITNNTIISNSTGITIATTAKPAISFNSISFGGTGIFVSAGSPAITGNDINNNSVGVDVELSSVSPVIRSNALFCNTVTDLFTNMTSTLDLTNNAWDHDPSTAPPGPYASVSANGASGCIFGSDVCYQGAQPRYLPSNPAVPGGCLSVGKPLIR